MFNTLGVALYCLLGACPVFVAGTGRKMSSPYLDELTLTHRVSSLHIHIVHQLLPVPFRVLEVTLKPDLQKLGCSNLLMLNYRPHEFRETNSQGQQCKLYS